MISCCINFKENLTENISYYKLLLKQMNDAQSALPFTDADISEHTALYSPSGAVLSKICEGYQFVIAFDGKLTDNSRLLSELKALGYRFTSNSDAELALVSYIHFGEKSPAVLKGCFSYVICDTMRRQVFAASDALASSPLFYAKTDGTYLLSSGIRGILAHPDIKPTVTSRGLSRLLFPQSGGCDILDGISLLPPSHFLKIKNGDFLIKSYKSEYAADSSDECLFPGCTAETEKVGVILSDNDADRLLCCIAAEKQAANFRQIHTYSIGVSPMSEKYSAAYTQILPGKDALLASLVRLISTGGIPVFSENDYMLAPVLAQAVKDGVTLIHAHPGLTAFPPADVLFRFTEKLLHPAVAETLPSAPQELFAYCTARPLAASLGANIKICPVNTVVFRARESADENLTGYTQNYAAADSEYRNEIHRRISTALSERGFENLPPEKNSAVILRRLKHILLEIVSSDTAPLTAFFDKTALLRLCERGTPFGIRCETAFLAYLIKINIWLETFRPRII